MSKWYNIFCGWNKSEIVAVTDLTYMFIFMYCLKPFNDLRQMKGRTLKKTSFTEQISFYTFPTIFENYIQSIPNFFVSQS